MTNNIGVDVGFGFVKATDGTQRYIFPSVVGDARELRYKTGMGSDNILDNLAVQVDGEDYFVGDLANRQSEFLLSTQSQKRVSSIENKVLFNTSLVLFNAPVTKESQFNLVTGLPVDEYKEYKYRLKEQIKGSQVVHMVYNGHKYRYEIVIDKCKVIPQPFGTLFNELLTASGKVDKRELSTSKIGVIDIGFRTTDLVVADNLEFVEKLSITVETAMSSAYKLITRNLKEELGFNKPIYQMEKIIRDGRLSFQNETIELNDLITKAYNMAAKKIASEVSSLWSNLWEFDYIFITGGGGIALYKYIDDLLEFNNCLKVANGQFGNVDGYLKVANRSF